MSVEQNKAVVRRFYEGDGDGRDNTEHWHEICAPEMTVIATVLPVPIEGLEAVTQFTRGMHSAFSDLGFTVDALVAEGDQVAASWTMTGTHTAPLLLPTGELAPTGKTIAVTGTSLCTLRDGKLAEERVQADWLGMLQQLGVIPGF